MLETPCGGRHADLLARAVVHPADVVDRNRRQRLTDQEAGPFIEANDRIGRGVGPGIARQKEDIAGPLHQVCDRLVDKFKQVTVHFPQVPLVQWYTLICIVTQYKLAIFMAL